MAAVIGSLVVGTDGSHTAAVAVGRAVALARAFDARLSIVSAFEPVPSGRLRGAMPEPPQDVEWALNPRRDPLPARLGPEPGLPSRPLLGPDRPHELVTMRRSGSPGPGGALAPGQAALGYPRSRRRSATPVLAALGEPG
jgi:nucleotide-binding universal stress UspA family protein